MLKKISGLQGSTLSNNRMTTGFGPFELPNMLIKMYKVCYSHVIKLGTRLPTCTSALCHQLKGVDSAAQACGGHLPEKVEHYQIGARACVAAQVSASLGIPLLDGKVCTAPISGDSTIYSWDHLN